MAITFAIIKPSKSTTTTDRATRPRKEIAMKVTDYIINKGTTSECYGLKNAEDNQVLYSAPNNWKTLNGAKRWAIKNGFEYIEK